MLVVNGKQVVTQVHGPASGLICSWFPRSQVMAGCGCGFHRALWTARGQSTTGQSDLQASLETTVLLSDGETLVLGGLIHQREWK